MLETMGSQILFTEYNEGNSHFFIAQNGSMAEVEIVENNIVLHGITVVNELQNKKIGTQLLQEVEKYAKKHDCQRIIGSLGDNEMDGDPTEFYEKNLFVVSDGKFIKELISEDLDNKEIIIDKNSSLETVLLFVNSVEQNEVKEFVLPDSINFDLFFLEVGDVKRDYELGGYYDLETRKITFTRSVAQHSSFGYTGEGLPNIGYHQNKDEFGRITGNRWHTHPWEVQERIYTKRYEDKYRLEMNCTPSDKDNDTIFLTSLAEQVDGKNRVFQSLISASGFISETIAVGINLNIEKLVEMGCDEDSVNQLLSLLTYRPPMHMRNFAKKGMEEELFLEFVKFYENKMKFDGSFYNGIDDFVLSIKELLTETMFRRMTIPASQALKESMNFAFADYPDRKKLKRFGFETKEQQDAVLDMLGMRTNIYKIDENQKKVFLLENIFSCDVLEQVKTLKIPV